MEGRGCDPWIPTRALDAFAPEEGTLRPSDAAHGMAEVRMVPFVVAPPSRSRIGCPEVQVVPRHVAARPSVTGKPPRPR